MARGRKSSFAVVISNEERGYLERLLRSTTTPIGKARRARAILLLAGRKPITEIAAAVGMGRRHIYRWGERFIKDRCAGLVDLPRSGRPPVFSPRSSGSRCEDGVRDAGEIRTLSLSVG